MSSLSTDLLQALEQGRGTRVLVVGDLMLDEYIWGTVERVSPEAPVQVLEWVSQHDGLGGAANVAQNLVALGCEVWIAGVVGDDAKGERMRSLLRDCGVHTEDVLSDAQRPTTSKLRIMASSQQMLRIDRERRMHLGDEIQERLIKSTEARIPEVDGVIWVVERAQPWDATGALPARSLPRTCAPERGHTSPCTPCMRTGRGWELVRVCGAARLSTASRRSQHRGCLVWRPDRPSMAKCPATPCHTHLHGVISRPVGRADGCRGPGATAC